MTAENRVIRVTNVTREANGEARVNPIEASGSGAVSQVTCFRCGVKGHIARNYRKPPRRKESDDNCKCSGKRGKTAEEQPPDRRLYSVGCVNGEHDYITLELDTSQGHKLYFLVDSGADITLVKSYKLLGTAEFEPKDGVRVKSIGGAVIETHGSIQTRIREGRIDIPFRFQLVSQQVGVKGDGILGRDFLKLMQARICYKGRSLTFRRAGFVIHKKLISLPELDNGAHQGVGEGKLTLPASIELIVKLPVSAGSCIVEGLVEKAEIPSGVYLAVSLVKVNNGHIIIHNTRERDIEVPNPVVKVVELRDRDVGETAVIGVENRRKVGMIRAKVEEKIL